MANLDRDKITTYEVFGTSFKFLDPDGSVPAETTPGQAYEPATTACLKTLIEQQDLCFLDIGSHYGYFTVFVGKTNPNCSIYSFEPGSKHFEVLRENVRMNWIKANLYPAALSDENREIPFHDRTMKVAKGETTETVQAVIFDELSRTESIQADVVKLDVHGAEGKVLYGMKKALKNDIKHLFVEIHAAHLLVDYTHREVGDLLLKSGFTLFELDKFRDIALPVLVPLLGTTYENFVNPYKWTIDQVRRERMVLATKSPTSFQSIFTSPRS